MSRVTERISLPNQSIGSSTNIFVHRYNPNVIDLSEKPKKCYIQASLHADEIPGLLVSHHLIHLLDQAQQENRIKQQIVIVPFANPIGLGQYLLGSHIGRFSISTGVNFNRDWPDLTKQLIPFVSDKLSKENSEENVRIIRNAMKEMIKQDKTNIVEKNLKRILYDIACDADIVLDLHCDTDAVMHMYTHNRLWPALSDLAAEIGSECHLLAPTSGGNPFDEMMSCPWAALQDTYADYSIPMACQSVTIELRGEYDVNDEYARKDAHALYRFLTRRGYIEPKEELPPLPTLVREASPLDGVDMIEAIKAGVITYKVKIGDMVSENQVLAEIIDIEDPDCPRVPIVTRTSGMVFGMRHHRLVHPGLVVIKIAGPKSLDWRQGLLLTAK